MSLIKSLGLLSKHSCGISTRVPLSETVFTESSELLLLAIAVVAINRKKMFAIRLILMLNYRFRSFFFVKCMQM